MPKKKSSGQEDEWRRRVESAVIALLATVTTFFLFLLVWQPRFLWPIIAAVAMGASFYCIVYFDKKNSPQLLTAEEKRKRLFLGPTVLALIAISSQLFVSAFMFDSLSLLSAVITGVIVWLGVFAYESWQNKKADQEES